MSNIQMIRMIHRIRRLIKPFLLVALSVFLMVTACHKPSTQENNLSTVQAGAESECRVIKHKLGETCIPLEPKRIVALDTPAVLDGLIALDLKPVGAMVDHFGDGQDWSGNRYFPALLPELVEGIEIVGVEPTPSLEKILQLKPDLILIDYSFAKSLYEQLSKIAPCVTIDIWESRTPLEEVFRHIAKILGKEEKGEEVLTQLQERVSEFKNQLSEHLLNSEISVLWYYQNQFIVPGHWGPFFQVFQDVGLKIKPIHFSINEATTISNETVTDYDADIMFFVEANNPSQPLRQNPLIQTLEAVKNGQAYFTDGKAWDFYGPIGMNLFLDDLAKYLLEGKQDPYFQKP